MSNINGGGLMLPYSKLDSSKSIFINYLNNLGNVFTVSLGRYGIAVLLELHENTNMNNENKFYKKMVPNKYYGKIVKHLLIKIQFINREKLDVRFGDTTFTTTTELIFQNEINIQTDIFFKTLNYMQPLCPSIVYADIINNYPEKMAILNLLRKANNLPFRVENNVILNNDIGIIVMEMIFNSVPLYNYNDINNIELAKNISRYALLKLALDTGYNHNDFHPGNILIQQNNDYFKGIEISPMLIDFGRTTKLDLDILESVKQKVKNKDYIGALSELCKPYNSKLVHTRPEFHSYFNWVCGDYEGLLQTGKLSENTNEEIDKLFNLREEAIDENIKNMNELHDAEPDKYPLLPITDNSIKNKLYNGMIGGKKKQNRRQKRKTKRNKIIKKNKRNKTNRRNRTNKKYI